jgi:glycosyltransferase involved in cell wall biosynthesis
MKYLMTIWSRTPKDYFIIENLAKFLIKKNNNISIIHQSKGSEERTLFNLKCSFHKIFYSKNLFLNKFYFIYYFIYLFFFILINKPNKIIIFNNYPILIIQLIKFFYKGKLFYHNFDYNPFSKNLTQKFFNYLEKKNAYMFSKIILSNEKRAELFQKMTYQKITPSTVYNCLPIGSLKKFKKQKRKIIKIFRIGSIGPGHGLINLIKSFKYLSPKYHLTICGIIADKVFFQKILNIIAKDQTQNKIKILISPTQKVWTRLMINSDLGVAFYQPVNTSHKYMVGASQKINSYLAAGLPILLPDEKQFKSFTAQYNCSVNTNIKSPKIIAKTIKKIFLNKKKLNKLKKNSNLAFKNCFNFKYQIKKVDYYQ